MTRVRVKDAYEYTSLLRRAARTAVKAERLHCRGMVDVTLISDTEIRELNRIHRGIDKVTDVLSFPMPNEVDPTGRVFLGDVLISKKRAEEQAGDYGHSLERELAFLTVHGALHLLGYDHETERERAEMRGREDFIMEKLGVLR